MLDPEPIDDTSHADTAIADITADTGNTDNTILPTNTVLVGSATNVDTCPGPARDPLPPDSMLDQKVTIFLTFAEEFANILIDKDNTILSANTVLVVPA